MSESQFEELLWHQLARKGAGCGAEVCVCPGLAPYACVIGMPADAAPHLYRTLYASSPEQYGQPAPDERRRRSPLEEAPARGLASSAQGSFLLRLW